MLQRKKTGVFLVLLLCLATTFGGCSFPYKATSYYQGYANVINDLDKGWCTMTLIPDINATTFKIQISTIVIPTYLMHPTKYLQFTVPNNELAPGKSLNLKNLKACSVGIGYDRDAGRITQGKVTVESTGQAGVVLAIESSEFDRRFQGTHRFRRRSPGKDAMNITGLVTDAEEIQNR